MSVILYPINTEKNIRLMEAENKLIFAVDRKATKADIKKAVEELFKVKVTKVNTLISFNGKKAMVTFGPENPAIDVATTLGLI